jgi:hypothetical protein
MDYIPELDWDGRNGSFVFGFGPMHQIGLEFCFIIRDARAIQRFERVFTFSLSFSFFSLWFPLCFFSASCSLSCLHGRSGRVSLPSALVFVCSLLCSSPSKRWDHRTVFRSDQIRQSINQPRKKNSNNPCFPLQLLLFSNVKCLIPLIHLHTSDLTQHHSNSCRNMENIFPLLACILIDWPQTIQR